MIQINQMIQAFTSKTNQVLEYISMHYFLFMVTFLFIGFTFTQALMVSSYILLVTSLILLVLYNITALDFVKNMSHPLNQVPMFPAFLSVALAFLIQFAYLTVWFINFGNWSQYFIALLSALVTLILMYVANIKSRMKKNGKGFMCSITLTHPRFYIFTLGSTLIYYIIYNMFSGNPTHLLSKSFVLTMFVILTAIRFLPQLIRKKLPLLTQYTLMAYLMAFNFIIVIWTVIHLL